MQTPLTFIFIFVAVLVLMGLAGWLLRRFAGNRLGAQANRGRMPRLAVIDAAAVDGRRRLVLVRRDNIEHLLMIGGPTDIVVEANIVRAIPGRDQLPQRPAMGAEPAPRISPLPDAVNWSESDGTRADLLDSPPEPPMPEPPGRPGRTPFPDEVRRPAASLAERRSAERSDALTGFALDTFGARPEPRPELRGEPMPSRITSRNEPARGEPALPRQSRGGEAPKPPPLRAPERAVAPPPSASSQAMSAADQNLAEMAQRLEAALRRPAGDLAESRGPEPRITEPRVAEPRVAEPRAAEQRAAEPRVGAPPVAPEPPPSGQRGTPRGEPRAEPPAASAFNAPPSTGAASAAMKSDFENLEDEMASLLGRPKTPS